MIQPLECNLLCRILKRDLECWSGCYNDRPKSYKYRNGLSLDGCLIAHSILSFIEAQRVREIFRAPIYRIFRAHNFEQLSLLDMTRLWSIILSAILIHDIGKLTREYQESRRIKHHLVSAIVARRVFQKVLGKRIALSLSYAILFHHEAIDWRRLERDLLVVSYLREIISPEQLISYNVDAECLDLFEEAAKSLLKAVGETFPSFSTHEDLDQLFIVLTLSLKELRECSGKRLKLAEELDRQRVYDINYLVPSLVTYRLIFLTDNRAASARKTYWLDNLEEINWSEFEKISEIIRNRLTRARYYVGLSSVP